MISTNIEHYNKFKNDLMSLQTTMFFFEILNTARKGTVFFVSGEDITINKGFVTTWKTTTEYPLFKNCIAEGKKFDLTSASVDLKYLGTRGILKWVYTKIPRPKTNVEIPISVTDSFGHELKIGDYFMTVVNSTLAYGKITEFKEKLIGVRVTYLNPNRIKVTNDTTMRYESFNTKCCKVHADLKEDIILHILGK